MRIRSHLKSEPLDSIIADGYENLVRDIERQVREEVDAFYADHWKALGFCARRKLKRKIELEVARRSKQRMPAVSRDALF